MNALAHKLKRFADKEYRDGYLNTHVRGSIAYQIRAVRHKLGLSQIALAKRTNKTQSVISRLESDEYGQMSLQTLLDVASGFEVALLVRFVSYPEFLRQASDMSSKAMQVDTIFESLENNAFVPQTENAIRTKLHSHLSVQNGFVDEPRQQKSLPFSAAYPSNRDIAPTPYFGSQN